MLTLSIRGIRAHLGRFVLTGLAIVMSVGFLTGTFILFPTTTKMIDSQIGQAVGGVDVVVRRQQLDATTTGVSEIRPDLAAVVESIPGVVAVQPMRYESVAVSLPNGKSIGFGEGSTWADKPFDIARIRDGKRPTSATDIVLDRGTAKANSVQVGDSVAVSVKGAAPKTFVVSGLATFGEAESVGGLSAFMTPAAMEAATNSAPRIIWLLVSASRPELEMQQAIRGALPQGLEAVTGETWKAEQRQGFASTVTIFKSIIGGFAAVSFFVGAFLIANTFSIIVAQRTKEVALLRAIGALRKQVKRMVLFEAILVGGVCSFIGMGVGILMAKALVQLLRTGTGMPDPGPLVKPVSAFAVGLVVGVGATVAAAWMPIQRGTKIEPIAALRNDDVQVVPKFSKVRTAIGALMILAAILMGLLPIDENRFVIGAIGSLVGLVGVSLAAPSLVISFFTLLRPVMGRGAVGELAIDGARRSPRRTASTAAALMIGLSLVTGALIMVNSMKESVGTSFERQVGNASTMVSGSAGDDVVATIGSIPGVDKVQTISRGRMLHNDVTKDVTAISTSATLIDLDITQGSTLEQLKSGEVLVFTDVFEDGITVGSTINVAFRKSGKQQLKVVGVFANNTMTANYVVNAETGRSNILEMAANQILVGGQNPAALAASISSTLRGRGFEVQTIPDAIAANNKQLNGFLAFIMGLLAVSMLIALLGVVNTMALSVLERTRELGMLRAIGMTRRQIRQVIRREALAVSIFGVILGLLIGLPVGLVLVRGLSGVGVDHASIPLGQIALVAFVALSAGVLAALLPARRAAKLDVLTAISHV